MTHDPCKFCNLGKPSIENQYTCSVCGTVFYGKHFHFDDFNFCTLVCSKLMREHQEQQKRPEEVEGTKYIAYYSDCAGSAF